MKAMTNLDTRKQSKDELLTNVAQCLRDGDEDGVKKSFEAWSMQVHNEILEEAHSVVDSVDSAILQKRGVRQLTSQENDYYSKLIQAMKSSNPQMAVSNIDVAYPETVIETILGDIKTNHPLLNAIDFRNTSILTKIIVNSQGSQLAVWGAINSEITKELNGAIDEINLELCKLSAFMVITNDMLDLGPRWLDAYFREIMTEAIAIALETAIVDGTGKDQPIGMTRDVSDDVVVTGGEYPRKEAIKVTEFSPTAYGSLIKELSVKPNGGYRDITNLIMVVNPEDYFKTVLPATTMLTPNGGYVNNVLPYPTQIIQSVAVPSDHAVLGLAKRYFMGLGSNRNGKLEYSDDFKWLEDARTYKIKTHGNGRPLDNNAFLYLDISKVKEPHIKVEQIS
jgi:HK97 family phage major capsid protein